MPRVQEEKKRTETFDYRGLYPGELIEADAFKVRVWPIGFAHVERFQSSLAEILSIVSTARTPKGLDTTAQGIEIAKAVLPYAVASLTPIVRECARVESPKNPVGGEYPLDALPHWVYPAVVEKWIELSFGDPKRLAPWKGAMRSIMDALEGLSTSETPSSTS